MTFKEKIDKILDDNELQIESVTALEDFLKAGRGAINDFYNRDEDPGRKTLKRILSLPGLNKMWWTTGNGEPFMAASPEKHTREQNEPAVTEKAPKGDPEVYRTIVEGNTEYVLIPRTVLMDTKLISTEQIANDRKIMDRLLEQNEKMIAKLLTSQSELPGIKEGKNSP